MAGISPEIESMFPLMVTRRRDFHKYPEAGWEEFRTTSKIAEILKPAGWELHFSPEYLKDEYVLGWNIDLEKEKKRALAQGGNAEIIEKMGKYTGLYADLDTGRPGPWTMIRADIDCVEVTESDAENHLPVREGFRSVNPGRHHACGHDGHTAMGLAAAELIARNRDSLKGRFRMIFQPAEEGVRGGYAMVKAGVADKADYLLSYHLGIGEPTGTIVAGMKDALNTTKFDVHIIGRGAHAGMEPHLGKNALLAACQASLGLFSIAPHKDGPSRINVGVLQAGEGRNVVPPKALMKCETRGQTPEVAAYMYNRAMQIVEGAAKMYDCGFRIVKQGESIGADPSEDLVNLIAEEAGSINGVKARLWGKMGGSDDAFWFVDRVTKKGGKATYMIIGADTAAGHHNESFDFDEKCMPIGVETIWRIVKRLNSK